MSRVTGDFYAEVSRAQRHEVCSACRSLAHARSDVAACGAGETRAESVMWSHIKSFGKDLYAAYRKWQADDGSHLAASVSFYLALSFFPVLLIGISAVGFALQHTGWGQDARAELLELIADQTAPSLAGQIEAVLSNVERSAGIGGPLGVLGLLLAAMVIFVNFDDAMNRIWNAPPSQEGGIVAAGLNLLINRLRAFVMLLGLGLFVIVGFVAAMSLSVVQQYAEGWFALPTWLWEATATLATVALNWLLFTVVYRVIPNVPVRWSEAARGALFASIMWEIGRRLLAGLIIGSKFSVYGIVGAFVAIMLWMFYAMAILFLGAEYIQTYCERCNRAE